MDYSPVRPIFEAMQTQTLGGVSLADLVGGGDPATVAGDMVEVIRTTAGLQATDNILDIGCGCGRFATALTQHLSPSSRYWGIDILPGLIDFCRMEIAARFPNFEFATIDQGNQFYDQLRGNDPAQYISRLDDICDTRTVDLCVAMSLFTHLGVDATAAYLADIRRALKPEGRAALTFFILDPSTRALMRGGQPAFRFPHVAADGTFIEHRDSPMHAVAFDAMQLNQLITDAGFYIAKVQHGNWVARRGSANFQDVVVLRPRIRA